MSDKHTPGPWRLSFVEDGGIKHLVPVDQQGTSLLTVVHEGGYDGGEVTPFGAVYRDADAILIAAAPDLLAAVRLLLSEVVFDGTAGTELAWAAIRKATGKGARNG